jgi:hypothetical protein
VLLKFGHLMPMNRGLGIAAIALNAAVLAFLLAFHLVGIFLHNRRLARVPLSLASTDHAGNARSVR